MKTKQKLFICFTLAIFLLCVKANAQKLENNGNITISYLQRKEMSVEDFFQRRMKQSKQYKVVGKKLEIFFEKDNVFFLGRNLLSGSDKSIKVDTLYTIPQMNLVNAFPDYQMEGEAVRDVIYKYLYKNVLGFSGTVSSKFIYKLDKKTISVDYENVSHKYIMKKSAAYHFKISTHDLKILDFKKY